MAGNTITDSDPSRLITRPRFRFVSYFVECLIHNLYQSPHRLLNKFIASSTGYQPSDAESLVVSEDPSGPLLPTGLPISSIDFDELQHTDRK